MERKDRFTDKWNVMRGSEKGDVKEEWQLFKSAIVGCTKKVCGMRRV